MLLFCDGRIIRKRHRVFKLCVLPRAFCTKEYHKDTIYFGLLPREAMTLQSSFKWKSGNSSSTKERRDMLQAFLCDFVLLAVHQTAYAHSVYLHYYYYHSVQQHTYVHTYIYKYIFFSMLLLLFLLF